MGDASALTPELCQVWSIGLEGVDIRSSRSRHAATENGQGSVPGAVSGNIPGDDPTVVPESISNDISRAGPGVVPGAVPSAAVGSSATVGSSLLRNTPRSSSSPPGDVTVEVSTPLMLRSHWSIFLEVVCSHWLIFRVAAFSRWSVFSVAALLPLVYFSCGGSLPLVHISRVMVFSNCSVFILTVSSHCSKRGAHALLLVYPYLTLAIFFRGTLCSHWPIFRVEVRSLLSISRVTVSSHCPWRQTRAPLLIVVRALPLLAVSPWVQPFFLPFGCCCSRRGGPWTRAWEWQRETGSRAIM